MKLTLALGIMSGTSIDGVDYALCAISEGAIKLREVWSARFPARLQQRLHEAAKGASNSWELAQLHHDLGRFYAVHARKAGSRVRPRIVGLHGQTVFHNPQRKNPATLQVGEPTYLSEALGAPVVSNFRAADLAAGGQGAPLATMFHKMVFGERQRHVCVNNLGGISNVTSIDWRRGEKPKVAAFDTGPANVLMDLAVRHFTKGRQHFDREGAWAACGQLHEPLLREWLKHPFFQEKPPKSTGRELFGEAFLETALSQSRRSRLSQFDLLATLAALTAQSLVLNYRLHLPSLPDKVILSGGGAANATLRGLIRDEFLRLDSSILVQTSEEEGWPLQSIEPAAFALLAWLRMRGQAGNLPETTGAKREVLLGCITNP